MSHHLVLLPRPLEVQAAVFPALDHRPAAAGCFHVAVHLHSWEEDEGEGRREVMELNVQEINLFIDISHLSGIDKQWWASQTMTPLQTLLFPAFPMNHLWECNISVVSSDLIGVSLSLAKSCVMLRAPGFCSVGSKPGPRVLCGP